MDSKNQLYFDLQSHLCDGVNLYQLSYLLPLAMTEIGPNSIGVLEKANFVFCFGDKHGLLMLTK